MSATPANPPPGPNREGIYLSGTTDSTVIGNTTDHNSRHGIHLSGSSNNLVSNNVSFGNAQGNPRDASGIRLDGSHQQYPPAQYLLWQ